MNIYDFLITEIKDNKLTGEEKQKIIGKFIDRFVDEQLISQYILYWNSTKSEFRIKMKRISHEKLNALDVRNLDNLYIYLERHKELFKGNIQVILDFLEQQEPWEDTDLTVFDESYNWLIAFTHEDEIISIES